MNHQLVQPKEDVIFKDLRMPFIENKLIKEDKRELRVSLTHAEEYFFVHVCDLSTRVWNLFYFDSFWVCKKMIKEPFSLIFKPFREEYICDEPIVVYPVLQLCS